MYVLLQPHVPDHRYTSVLGKFYPQQAQNFEAERKPAEVRVRGATGRKLVKLGFLSSSWLDTPSCVPGAR